SVPGLRQPGRGSREQLSQEPGSSAPLRRAARRGTANRLFHSHAGSKPAFLREGERRPASRHVWFRRETWLRQGVFEIRKNSNHEHFPFPTSFCATGQHQCPPERPAIRGEGVPAILLYDVAA